MTGNERFVFLALCPLHPGPLINRAWPCRRNPLHLDLCKLLVVRRPCLGQGKGGAWDHRRCGTCFVTAMAPLFQQQLLVCVSAICQASKASPLQTFRRPFQGNCRSYTPQPSVFKGVQDCRLPAFKPLQPFRRPFQGNSRSYLAQPYVFQDVQDCRSPAFKPLKPFRKPFQGNSRSYAPQPSVFKSVQDCRFSAFKPLQPFRVPFQGNSRSYTPQQSVFKGVQDCRLPALKPFQPSNLPAGLSKATLAATRPSHLFLRVY